MAAKNSLIEPQTHVPTSDSEIRAAIGAKSAFIVGMVLDDGVPHAARAFGIRVPYSDRPRCRVILGADELPSLVRRDGRKTLALTVTDVRTLASVQFKGPSGDPEPASDDDLATMQVQIDQFMQEVCETDGTPRELLERMLPFEYVACEMDVECLFDQTPGPRAGSPFRSTS